MNCAVHDEVRWEDEAGLGGALVCVRLLNSISGSVCMKERNRRIAALVFLQRLGDPEKNIERCAQQQLTNFQLSTTELLVQVNCITLGINLVQLVHIGNTSLPLSQHKPSR